MQDYRVEEAVGAKDSAKTAKAIGKMLHKKESASNMVHMEKPDGTKAESLIEDYLVLRDYFAEIFQAELSSFAAVVDRDRQQRLEDALAADLPEIDVSILPTFFDLPVP